MTFHTNYEQPAPPGSPVPIAFCITDLDRGGAEQALVRLVTGLDRRRWNPTVYCLSRRGDLAEELAAAGIPVVCLGARGWWSVSVVARLVRHLRRQRPPLLQTYLYHANIVGRLAARAAGVPHVVSGIRVAEKRGRLRLWMERITAPLVERHVCVSRAVAEFSIREGGLPQGKVLTIPNGVDFDRFDRAEPAELTQFGIPADADTVLFIGRLDHQKGPDVLLEAATRMAESGTGDRIHILLIGDGPLREALQRRVEESNLAGRVHFAGRRTDVSALMKAADCLAVPSRWEGLPNVVLEAMAAALPVVATQVEGVNELLEDGRTGRLVPPENPEALARAVSEVLTRPEDSRGLAVSAQDVVAETFTWSRVIAEYEQLYESLLVESG